MFFLIQGLYKVKSLQIKLLLKFSKPIIQVKICMYFLTFIKKINSPVFSGSLQTAADNSLWIQSVSLT